LNYGCRQCSGSASYLDRSIRDHIKARPVLSRISQARAKATIISRYCFIGDIIITDTSARQILPGPDWIFQYLSFRLINYRAILYNVENI